MTIFAKSVDYIVHADIGNNGSGTQTNNYNLVDQAGNLLVDESGNELVAPFLDTLYGEVIYAKGTDYTVHAEA